MRTSAQTRKEFRRQLEGRLVRFTLRVPVGSIQIFGLFAGPALYMGLLLNGWVPGITGWPFLIFMGASSLGLGHLAARYCYDEIAVLDEELRWNSFGRSVVFRWADFEPLVSGIYWSSDSFGRKGSVTLVVKPVIRASSPGLLLGRVRRVLLVASSDEIRRIHAFVSRVLLPNSSEDVYASAEFHPTETVDVVTAGGTNQQMFRNCIGFIVLMSIIWLAGRMGWVPAAENPWVLPGLICFIFFLAVSNYEKAKPELVLRIHEAHLEIITPAKILSWGEILDFRIDHVSGDDSACPYLVIKHGLEHQETQISIENLTIPAESLLNLLKSRIGRPSPKVTEI